MAHKEQRAPYVISKTKFVNISHYGYSKDIHVKTKALSLYKYMSIPLKTIQTYGVGSSLSPESLLGLIWPLINDLNRAYHNNWKRPLFLKKIFVLDPHEDVPDFDRTSSAFTPSPSSIFNLWLVLCSILYQAVLLPFHFHKNGFFTSKRRGKRG
jgi:hypothetical protein